MAKVCALKCFCCGKELFNCGRLNQPLRGTEFSGGGDYGSEVTDEPGIKHILNICDDCIINALLEGKVRKIKREYKSTLKEEFL